VINNGLIFSWFCYSGKRSVTSWSLWSMAWTSRC